MALKKTCRCGKIINYEDRYCSQCTKQVEEARERSKKERNKRYARNRTDVKEQKFYQSRAWKVTRQAVAQRDNFLCLVCLENKEIRNFHTVHHIEELKENWDKRLDEGNLISVCKKCHENLHNEYDKGAKEKKKMQNKLFNIISRK